MDIVEEIKNASDDQVYDCHDSIKNAYLFANEQLTAKATSFIIQICESELKSRGLPLPLECY